MILRGDGPVVKRWLTGPTPLEAGCRTRGGEEGNPAGGRDAVVCAQYFILTRYVTVVIALGAHMTGNSRALSARVP